MGSSSMPETDSKEKRAGLHSGYFGPFSHGRCCRQTKYSSAEPAEPGEVRKSGYARRTRAGEVAEEKNVGEDGKPSRLPPVMNRWQRLAGIQIGRAHV